MISIVFFFFFSSRRRHTRWTGDWSSDVCSSDLAEGEVAALLEVTAGLHGQLQLLPGRGRLGGRSDRRRHRLARRRDRLGLQEAENLRELEGRQAGRIHVCSTTSCIFLLTGPYRLSRLPVKVPSP